MILSILAYATVILAGIFFFRGAKAINSAYDMGEDDPCGADIHEDTPKC